MVLAETTIRGRSFLVRASRRPLAELGFFAKESKGL
jgi:hypothetical protein